MDQRGWLAAGLGASHAAAPHNAVQRAASLNGGLMRQGPDEGVDSAPVARMSGGLGLGCEIMFGGPDGVQGMSAGLTGTSAGSR